MNPVDRTITVECLAQASICAEEGRPTPAQIDTIVAAYEQAEACFDAAKATLDTHKKRLIALALGYGDVPAGAEKSTRLLGQLTEITVTQGSTIALKDSAVAALEAALNANDCESVFGRLFSAVTKYKLVKGADKALRTAGLPQRLADKVMRMYGACFDVKTNAPSLKITRLAEQPKRKPRARKVAA
jgi:hypothetical protein